MKRQFLTVIIVLLLCAGVFSGFASAQVFQRSRQPRANPTPQRNDSDSQRTISRVDSPSRQTSNQPGVNYAILIGINEYLPTDEKTNETEPITLRNLRYCIADMTELKASLIRCKYAKDENIVLLVTTPGTTCEAILNTLQEFGIKLKSNDNILVAFSGHGVSLASMHSPEKEDDYFCCSDTKVAYLPAADQYRHQGLLSLSEINNILESYPCKSKIVIADACRNILPEEGTARSTDNSVVNASNAILSRSTIRGMSGNTANRQKEISGFFRMASCSKDEISLELEKLKHGVFTYHLVHGLNGDADSDGNGSITLSELFQYTSTQTSDYVTNHTVDSKQTPTFSNLEATGDFKIGQCEPKKRPTPEPPINRPPPPSRLPPLKPN